MSVFAHMPMTALWPMQTVLSAVVAGALAALLVGLCVVAWRRSTKETALLRYVVAAAAGVLILFGVTVLAGRMASSERIAGRQALLGRAAQLDRSTLIPGSILPCVDGTAGETVGNACEKRVFANAGSTAAAVAYIGARINLLTEAYQFSQAGDPSVLAAIPDTRRIIALDRYGIAAHVLADRDGCTAKHCAVFAMVSRVDVLKSNLSAQIFDQYVSRYAGNWGAPVRGAPTMSSVPAVSSVPTANSFAGVGQTPPVNSDGVTAAKAPSATTAEASNGGVHDAPVRPGEHWDFPSADSIPPVSIINPEPKLTKDAAARLDKDDAKAVAREHAAGNAQPSVKKPSAEKATKKHPQPGDPLPLR